MKIDVLTIYPGMFPGPLDESIVKRARESGRLQLGVRDLRDYAHDRHRTVDDRPFGGGPGMLMKPEPLFEAVEDLRGETTRVILTRPAGRPFRQEIARALDKSVSWTKVNLLRGRRSLSAELAVNDTAAIESESYG